MAQPDCSQHDGVAKKASSDDGWNVEPMVEPFNLWRAKSDSQSDS